MVDQYYRTDRMPQEHATTEGGLVVRGVKFRKLAQYMSGFGELFPLGMKDI